MLQWHKDLVEQSMDHFNLDWYGILWLSFFKGLIYGGIIMYILK